MPRLPGEDRRCADVVETVKLVLANRRGGALDLPDGEDPASTVRSVLAGDEIDLVGEIDRWKKRELHLSICASRDGRPAVGWVPSSGNHVPPDEMERSVAHKIAVVGGDGIGPDVVAEGLRVVAAVGVQLDTTEYDLGGRYYARTGDVFPDEVMEELRGFDAIYLGAVGTPEVPPGVIERGLLLKMRFGLDQYVNLRPFENPVTGLDCVFIRENTEGTYAGEGGFLRKGTPFEIATQGSVNTRMGVERAIRFAFELARTRPRKHLTLVHKTNVLTFAGDLWQRTFTEVAVEYPDITTGYDHVDAACIHLVERPTRYDVVVTDNLFGDILTDLAGAVSGGIGLAASANLNPARTSPSMFEPVHGSAPDIVGQGIASPLAAIKSAAMMLDFLGDTEPAARILAAVTRVAAATSVEGAGITGTTALADAVIADL